MINRDLDALKQLFNDVFKGFKGNFKKDLESVIKFINKIDQKFKKDIFSKNTSLFIDWLVN